MPCGTLDWILEQKKNIDGKTGAIQTNSSLDNSIVPMLIFGFDHCPVIIQGVNLRGNW